jgi:hypothetical protein
LRPTHHSRSVVPLLALGAQKAAKPKSVDAVTAQGHYHTRDVYGALAITSFAGGAAAVAGGLLTVGVGPMGE